MEKYPRIRNLREDSDLTQQQVGAAINVPQRTYAYYEGGQRMVPPHVLCALADFYKVSVDYLPGRTDTKNQTDNEAVSCNFQDTAFVLRANTVSLTLSP